jgi:hypothetical protein
MLCIIIVMLCVLLLAKYSYCYVCSILCILSHCVLCIVLCKCVLYYATGFQPNCSKQIYHIISYHIISYHIIQRMGNYLTAHSVRLRKDREQFRTTFAH